MTGQQRRHARRRSTQRNAFALSACLFALGGCNLAPLGADHLEVNTCKVQADCSGDAECRSGRCMARSTPAPLRIAVEVTPRRTLSTVDALPFRFEPLVVTEPVKHEYKLPAPIAISAMLRNAGVVYPASITFTPAASVPGIPVKAVSATTSASGLRKNADYVVQLFDGVDYRMLVRPTDAHAPPFRRTFRASADLSLDVDYADLPTDERTFAITGAPMGSEVILSAYDRLTGEPVSSTETLNEGGKAKLAFAPGVSRYRLEIRLSGSSGGTSNIAASAKTADTACDASAPAYPLFTIPDDQIGTDQSSLIGRVRLPEMPTRIRYEGTVALCGSSDADPMLVANLPIALRSTKLLTEQMQGLSASYNATTNARWDLDTRQFRYCVQVQPGEYDVVVTPPAEVRCSLFAEHRLIQAPADGNSATGAQLELPKPLYVSGALQAMDGAPLKDATVDAVSLGRPDAPEDVASNMRVTRFNRSQEASSDPQGAFKLPVDAGSYDILIKPPAASGFPWQVRYDVRVDDSTQGDAWATRISMVSPVSVEGTLRSAGMPEGTTLDGATLDAYALVTDSAGTERAISIGKAVSDADARFVLLLPPSTDMHWGREDDVR